MTKDGRIYIISLVTIFLLGCFFQALPVKAGEPSLPPHLIQSVSEEDIFEGMLAFDLFHRPVLEEPDLEAACENVRNSIVRINMGNAYGSGVIYRITADGAVIATNRHVLDYWREETGVVRFAQGYYANARMLGSSKNYDVGFLLVEKEEIGVQALCGLRSVVGNAGIDTGLLVEEEIFYLGAGREEDELIFQKGVLKETDQFIENFGKEMLYGQGFAKEGMSGGGMFDGCGRLVGLLAGGTDRNEIAGVPVTQVLEAYWEVTGKE